uniref:C2H2-type domain-containing protein n=1 Tax=Mola mola TaxID=94237 RepID=A0A3Q4ACZ4_MOLML
IQFLWTESLDPIRPLPSLRLLVPPLQLLSAAMWQLAKQKDVRNYERLQEFVLMVTEAVPGLINHRQRAQLILGLRARVTVTIQVKKTESTFIALVQSLLKDPVERAYFFQEVFPVEYGPQYDAALHVLLWELLSKLEKLLPVPDLKQTVAWLGLAPPLLEECVQSSPEDEAQLHQRIHTGEKPYPCNTCELKFRSSSELARHKRSHSGLRPLKPHCEQCMRTFTSKAKLKKHLETHREEEEAARSVNSVQAEESNTRSRRDELSG